MFFPTSLKKVYSQDREFHSPDSNNTEITVYALNIINIIFAVVKTVRRLETCMTCKF